MTNFSVEDLATGLYRFQLEISRWTTTGGLATIRLDTGTVIVVNRKASPFGAGWWLAGFEQLNLQYRASGRILWVGGDGSARVYDSVGAWSGKNWFVARALDRPDTLSFDGTTFTRQLRGGSRVLFNSAGIHAQTVNRLGYATVFTLDGSNRLATIAVPPTGVGLSYTFTYNGPNGTLSSVAAPDTLVGTSRTTSVAGAAITGGARVTAIIDPTATASVQFTYGNPSYAALITARTNRRLATTSFMFGAGLKLVGSSLPVAGAATITRTFCPAEVRVWACGSGLTSPDSTYTIYDGPRADSATDVTHFWLDTLGAVSQVRDPFSQITTVAKTDSRFPALPTRVQSPDGRVLKATYDARGNLASVTDSARYGPSDNPVTSYQWNQSWDALAQITLPNGQLTRFNINAVNGNVNYVEDARGSPARTTFSYYATGNGAGLLNTVVDPGGATTTLAYDVRANLASMQQPLGWTTYLEGDRLGRPRVIRTPLGPLPSTNAWRNDSTAYDARDRIIRTVTAVDSVPAPARSVTARNFYDDEGNLYRVERTQSPNPTGLSTLVTQRIFDVANRPIVAIAEDGFRDTTWFGPGGVADSVRTRRGHTIRMWYDRLNRLTRRTVPAVGYASLLSPGYIGQIDLEQDSLNGSPFAGPRPYPWFPTDGSNYTIAADTAAFRYNVAGDLILADNADAHVRRGYNKDGTLLVDTLEIRNWSSATFGHRYILRYTYDLNGRLSALHHPSQLAAGTGMRDSVRYVYNDTTGALRRVHGLLAPDSTTFLYDQRGRLIRTDLPGGISDSLGYDDLGRLILDQIRNASTSPYRDTDPSLLLRSTTLGYADLVHVVWARNARGWKDTVTAQYSGLGHLLSLGYVRPPGGFYSAITRDNILEGFTLDPLGNTSTSTTAITSGQSFFAFGGSWSEMHWTNASSRFNAQTARIDSTTDANGRYKFAYDSAGNTRASYQASSPGSTLADRFSFYGADGLLRAAEARDAFTSNDWMSPAGWHLTFEEYRYDALGRRVLVMDRRRCYVGGSQTVYDPCLRSRVRRTVWDGTRELWEIQMPAQPQDGAWIENDVNPVNYPAGYYYLDGQYSMWTDPNPLFGRVAYTYAGGVDRPVSVTRLGLVRRPVNESYVYWNPVVLAPHWNWRGQADFGTFGDGGVKTCTDAAHCVRPLFRQVAFAVGLTREGTGAFADNAYIGWFGTVIDGKPDGTGTLYRRNRYVDPTTGRFTQEDPIGLAGGLNLYGFAAGDPVTFTDPFGFEPCKDADGKVIPCPEPAGGPPVPLPGGRTWVPADGPSTQPRDGEGRGPRYGPSSPIPGGVPQPGASWDPDGHWDVDNLPGSEPGRKGRRRFAPDGTEVTHDGERIIGPQQFPTPSPEAARNALLAGMTYWIISETLRVVFPPRNLIPVP